MSKPRSNMGPKDRIRRLRILHRAQGGVCAWCWQPSADPDEAKSAHSGMACDPLHPTLDHVKTRRRGGSNALGNLLLMHYACNAARGDGPLNERASIMHSRVLGWLELQYGQVPDRQGVAA